MSSGLHVLVTHTTHATDMGGGWRDQKIANVAFAAFIKNEIEQLLEGIDLVTSYEVEIEAVGGKSYGLGPYIDVTTSEAVPSLEFYEEGAHIRVKIRSLVEDVWGDWVNSSESKPFEGATPAEIVRDNEDVIEEYRDTTSRGKGHPRLVYQLYLDLEDDTLSVLAEAIGGSWHERVNDSMILVASAEGDDCGEDEIENDDFTWRHDFEKLIGEAVLETLNYAMEASNDET